MGGLMSRNKGQRGEREVIKLLQPILDDVYGRQGLDVPQLERNLMQSAKGGFDISGLEWMALEVKYQEADHLEQWWEQCKRQAMGRVGGVQEGQMVKEPILFFRKNKVRWQVRMYGSLDVGSNGARVRMPVIVSDEHFLIWFKHKILNETKKLIEQYEGCSERE